MLIELNEEDKRQARRLERMRIELEVRHLLSDLLPKFLNRALEDRGYPLLLIDDDEDQRRIA